MYSRHIFSHARSRTPHAQILQNNNTNHNTTHGTTHKPNHTHTPTQTRTQQPTTPTTHYTTYTAKSNSPRFMLPLARVEGRLHSPPLLRASSFLHTNHLRPCRWSPSVLSGTPCMRRPSVCRSVPGMRGDVAFWGLVMFSAVFNSSFVLGEVETTIRTLWSRRCVGCTGGSWVGMPTPRQGLWGCGAREALLVLACCGVGVWVIASAERWACRGSGLFCP